jgi:hypothetical protein
MKTKMSLALVVAGIGAAVAQTPGLTSCYLDVQNISNSAQLHSFWETSWGSYDRDRFDRTFLHIRAGTVGHGGGTARVAWYFIAQPIATGATAQDRYVYGRGEQMIEIRPGYFAECSAASPPLKSHTLHLALAGRHNVSGALHSGWLVTVTDVATNRVAGIKGSSQDLERQFNTDAFAAMLRGQERN